MKTAFCTKRNASGNRKILIIDHERREYSRESFHWFCRDDFVECSLSDFRKMESKAENAGYKAVDRLDV